MQGLRFYIDLDGLGTGSAGVLQHLQNNIVNAGGQLVQDPQSATHAVLRHKEQQAYQQVLQQLPGSVQVVTVQWVLLSALRKQLLPPSEDDLYPAAAIPGFAEQVRQVTLSGIQGVDRALTRYKVECTGALFSASMPLPATSHVITTAAACEQPSDKIIMAAKRHVQVLSIEWVDDCLAAWKYIPEDAYKLIQAGGASPAQQPQQQPQQQQQPLEAPPPQQQLEQHEAEAAVGAAERTVAHPQQQQQQQQQSPAAPGSGPSGLHVPATDQSGQLQLKQQKQQRPSQQQDPSQQQQQQQAPVQGVLPAADRLAPVTGTIPVQLDAIEEEDEAAAAAPDAYVAADDVPQQQGPEQQAALPEAPAAAAGDVAAERLAITEGLQGQDDADAESSDETVASEADGRAGEVDDEVQSGKSPAAEAKAPADGTYDTAAEDAAAGGYSISLAAADKTEAEGAGQAAADPEADRAPAAADDTVDMLDTVVLNAGPAVTGETPAMGPAGDQENTLEAQAGAVGTGAVAEASEQPEQQGQQKQEQDQQGEQDDEGDLVATEDFEELTITQQKRQQQQQQEGEEEQHEEEEEFLTAPERAPEVFLTPAESLGAAAGSVPPGRTPGRTPLASAAAATPKAAVASEAPTALQQTAEVAEAPGGQQAAVADLVAEQPATAATDAPAGEEPEAAAAAAVPAAGAAARGVRWDLGSGRQGSAGSGSAAAGLSGASSLDIRATQFMGNMSEAIAGANKTVGNLLADLAVSPEDSPDGMPMLPHLQQLSPVAAAPAAAAAGGFCAARKGAGGTGTRIAGSGGSGASGQLGAAGYRVAGLKRPSAADAGSGGRRSTARGSRLAPPAAVSPLPATEEQEAEMQPEAQRQQQHTAAGRGRSRGRSGKSASASPEVAAAAARLTAGLADKVPSPAAVNAGGKGHLQKQQAAKKGVRRGSRPVAAPEAGTADAQEGKEQPPSPAAAAAAVPAKDGHTNEPLGSAVTSRRGRTPATTATGDRSNRLTPKAALEKPSPEPSPAQKTQQLLQGAGRGRRSVTPSPEEPAAAVAAAGGLAAAAAKTPKLVAARRQRQQRKQQQVEELGKAEPEGLQDHRPMPDDADDLMDDTLDIGEQHQQEQQPEDQEALAPVTGTKRTRAAAPTAARKRGRQAAGAEVAEEVAVNLEAPAATVGKRRGRAAAGTAAKAPEPEPALMPSPAHSAPAAGVGVRKPGRTAAPPAKAQTPEPLPELSPAAEDASVGAVKGGRKRGRAAAAPGEQAATTEDAVAAAVTGGKRRKAAPAVSAAAARGARGKAAAANDTETAEHDGSVEQQPGTATAAAAAPAVHTTGRGRRAKPAADDAAEQQSQAAANAVEPKTRSTRRGKRRQQQQQEDAPERQQQQQEEEIVADGPPKPAAMRGRGAKHQQQLEEEEAEEVQDAASPQHQQAAVGSRDGRRARAAKAGAVAAAAAEEEEQQQPAVTAQKSSKGKKGAVGKAAEAAAAAAQGEEDTESPAAATASKAGKTATKASKQSQAKHRRGKAKQQEDIDSELQSDSADDICAAAAGGSSGEPVVALSGMHSDVRAQYAAVLKKLKVRCLPQSHDWPEGTTHVVLQGLKRSEKTLAAMAAGAWLVDEQWLKDSAAAGRLLDAEGYELDTCENGAITDGAPMHWRLRRQAGLAASEAEPAPSLAFQGLRVIFYGKSSSAPFDSLVKILKAGDGEVLRRAAPYTPCLPTAAPPPAAGSSKKKGAAGRRRGVAAAAGVAAGVGTGVHGAAANLAVIGPDKEDATDKWTSSFVATGVMCVKPSYLVEWLAHPWHDLDSHRLFGCEPSEEIAALEEARKSSGSQQQISMSF